MNDDASRVAREGKRQCASEPETNFGRPNLSHMRLRCLEEVQRSFTLKERCGETLRDCQDRRLMYRIVGQQTTGRKNDLTAETN